MEDTYVRLINYRVIFFDLQLPPLVPNILSCFSNHLGALFFVLLLSLPSSVLQWHHDGANFFLEYDRYNWLSYVGYYLCVLFSPIRSRTCSLVTFSDHFIFSIILQHPFLKLSRYFRSNFLSVQVSGPYKAML